jgi:outer membrane protein TolC
MGVVLAVSTVPGPRAARAVQQPQANPDSALAVTLAQIEGSPVTLDAAVQSALEQSTQAREAAAALASARATVKREKGLFDPELFGVTQKTSTEVRSSSPFAGSTKVTEASAGVRMHLPTGADVAVSMNATKNEVNSAFTSVNPEYDATGAITLEQPLLRGFGPGAHGDLTSAQRDLEAANHQYEDARLGVRADVEATYWSLYAAERDLAVQQLIRGQAKALLDQARLRAKAGIVGPSEVASARVFLAEQEQAVLDDEEQLDRISDALASLMGQRPEAGLPRFRPTDEPPRGFVMPPEDSLVTIALDRNHLLRSADRSVSSTRSLESAARWNALPQLNLFGSIGGTGLAGTGRDLIIGADTLRTSITGGYNDALTQVRHRDYPTWNAGLRFTIPIGLRNGRGERQRLHAEVQRSEAQKLALARSIEEAVRADYRELAYGTRRLQIAHDGVDAALEQVRIGLIDYDNGRTTAFELVRLGADLASAQQRYSQALVRAAKAAADLEHLTAGGYSPQETKP